MLDFEKSRDIAFQEISHFYPIQRILKNDISGQHHGATELWLLTCEIVDGKKNLVTITLEIVLGIEFPLSIPRIYLSQGDYEWIKFIPHLDINRFICTFDTETTKTVPNNPANIIYECIQRAKSIIELGLQETNLDQFDIEFEAYWDQSFHKNDTVKSNTLLILDEPPKTSHLTVLCLSKLYKRTFEFIVYESDFFGSKVKKYLDFHKINYKESSSFYCGSLEIGHPPYNLNNALFLSFLDATTKSSFERFINSEGLPKIVIFSKKIDTKLFYAAIQYDSFQNKIQGFRPNIIRPFDLISKFQSRHFIKRIKPENISKTRLTTRTSGNSLGYNLKITLVGLGSVGSNLIPILDEFNKPDYNFVDKDILKIENLGRHFLGMSYVNMYKAEALRNYILNNSILQDASSFTDSVLKIVTEQIEVLNDSDFIFVATGKANIEWWLAEQLKDGIIKKPMFFIWVEPYLVGGHIVYLTPEDPIYDTFFKDGLFIQNIIHEAEYKSGNAKLSLKEAGCQTTYTPYSSSSLKQFLNSLYPYLNNIVLNKTQKSSFQTWVGNKNILGDLGVEISDFGNQHQEGQLI